MRTFGEAMQASTLNHGPSRLPASIYGAIVGSGASVGLLLGGALTQWLDWRWVIYVNLIIAAIALTGALVLLRNQPADSRTKIDIPGIASVVLGLFGVVYGLSNAELTSWTNSVTVGSLVAGAALLLLFVWIESRVSNPLLPLRLLADRNRGASLVSIIITATGMFGVFLFLTYYLQQNLGYSALDSGVALLSGIYATAASRDFAASHNVAAATVYGYRVAFAVCAGIFFVGMVIAATLFEPRNARVAAVEAAPTAAA